MEPTRADTQEFIAQGQAKASSKYYWDLFGFLLLTTLVLFNIRNYFTKYEPLVCEPHDLAMWGLVGDMNLLPAAFLFLWKASSKYKYNSDPKFLKGLKNVAESDGNFVDTEAHHDVVHTAAMFLHGQKIRSVIWFLLVSWWCVWLVIGWMWYTGTTTIPSGTTTIPSGIIPSGIITIGCDSTMVEQVSRSLLIETIIYPLAWVCTACGCLASCVEGGSMDDNGSESGSASEQEQGLSSARAVGF